MTSCWQMTLLNQLAAVGDARYDSGYSTIIKRRGCTPQTREKVQELLQAWVRDPNGAKVFWMSGMAGTGKTTLGYTLCQWLEANKLLGANFFCSRASGSCQDLNRIVPTIAYQLAKYSPAFRSALCKVLEEDEDDVSRNVVRQFEKLIWGPLESVKDAIPEGVVVVIDALDECENMHGVRLMLEVLLKFAANLPLKFFVASRPEHAIRDKMTSRSGYSPSVMQLHDIEQSIVEEDIKKYLTEELSPIHPALSPAEINQLAKRAGNLFIYAATTVRYIYPGDIPVDTSARLQSMLAIDTKGPSEVSSDNPYSELDHLYTIVLAAAFNKRLTSNELKVMRLVIWTVVCAKEPMTPQMLGLLLGLTEQQVSLSLEPFRSVLHVSENNGLVSTLHASFPDYLLDSSRSGDFHCDQSQHSEFLARRCFDVMKEQLRFNICNLQSSFLLDKDVPDLQKRAEEAISPTLLYASRYWGEHLQLAAASATLCSCLAEFLSERLLFWMEVLNLRGLIGIGAPILHQVQSWLSVSGKIGLREFTH
jgi:hypothetical protein